ncbi:hypothetical protein [Sanguibacter massiliensis]|uniref:hypothetical protein n=1 Tax=Sanguibacter massiliensis TaxID=1973217 RepID=UPI0013EC7382|nr:hypothetical protein [Sanguibacter massiliensis]
MRVQRNVTSDGVVARGRRTVRRRAFGRHVGFVVSVGLALAGLVPTHVAVARSADIDEVETRADDLMPVEDGARLGLGGRYTLDGNRYRDESPWNWATPLCSTLAPEGSLVRLVSACTPGRLVSTLLDPVAYTVVSRTEVAFTQGLPIVGAVKVLGVDVYVVTGENNDAEGDAREVVRVSKLTRGLVHLGSTGIASGAIHRKFAGIAAPFEAGSPDLALVGTTLHLHMSRLMYGGPGGVRHQSNVTLTLDASTMTRFVETSDAYASHSFNQFVAAVDGAVVRIDHGDAHPRAVRAVVTGPGDAFDTYTLVALDGGRGANFTGVTVNGLATTGTVAAVAGISSPHRNAVRGITGLRENAAGQSQSNVYVALVDLATGTQKFVWLTDNHPLTSTTMVGEPSITTLPSGDLAVLFHVAVKRTDGGIGRRTEYRLVSPAGVVRASVSLATSAHLPTSPPVVVGDRLLWVTQRDILPPSDFVDHGGTRNVLRAIDVSAPTAPRTVTLPLTPFTRTSRPTVTEFAEVGRTLTADTGTWSPKPTFTYRWLRDGVAVRGATARTYTVTLDDPGHAINVEVTAHAKGRLVTTRISQETLVDAHGVTAPRIVGAARVGTKLVATRGVTVPAASSVTYAWYVDGVEVDGVHGPRYVVRRRDIGKRIQVGVRGEFSVGRFTKRSSFYSRPTAKVVAATSSRPFTAAPRPTVSGTARVGKKLTARAGTWKPAATVSYRWLRDGRSISGATRSTYTVTAADRGRRISVRVTARRAGYATTSKVSAARAVPGARFRSAPRPKVSGTARVGRTLTARAGTWRPAAKVRYQWLRSGKKIAGATKATYRLRAADRGARIAVRVTAVRSGYVSTSTTSRTTAVVRAG